MSHLAISLPGPFQVVRDGKPVTRFESGTARVLLSYLVELESWCESAHRQCMRALVASGQPGAALVQYRKCRQVLATELGVEPGPETQALYDRIRVGVRSQSTSARGGSGWRLLGRIRSGSCSTSGGHPCVIEATFVKKGQLE